MTGYHNTPSVLTLLVVLTASFLHLSCSNPINTQGDFRNTAPGLTVSEDGEKRDKEKQLLQNDVADEELFKDVDPRTLAAVLVEALNRSQAEKGTETDAERGDFTPEEGNTQVKMMERADRDRDGRQELELFMATQGKKQEEEERKKAQEVEEKMTEKVTSHTTSQTVQLPTEQQSSNPDGGVDDGNGKGAASEQGDGEEQLNPEELKSLETMMKEFPRVDTGTKRESRGYINNNYIKPMSKEGNLAMSKKKLKWQEETQKALNVPSFRGGNFMNDFEDTNYEKNAVPSLQPSVEQEAMVQDEPDQVSEGDDEEEKEEEEMLSPEEEEASAKAEQEEMRRQAAEAQRAKLEEEKLADIASDMLLRYMVKQTSGNKKYNPSLSNAAEDKRSDEEQELMEEDDIDPQTIDKLIEISSKLHLPADDVVDIISDVEKKKKKDVTPELASRWQQPLTPLSSSFSSKSGFVSPKVMTYQNKQPPKAVNIHKTWFQDKTPAEPRDRWREPFSSLLASQKQWPKPQMPMPMPIKQDFWWKSPKSIWSGYPSYPFIYPFYYQRKPYRDYYPTYFPPSSQPKPRYYISKPALTLSKLLVNSVDGADTFPPRRRYHSWVQPQLKLPPVPVGPQQRSYYSRYPIYPHSPFQSLSLPKPRSPPRTPVMAPPQKQRYYSVMAPVARKENYYLAGKQPDPSSSYSDDVENYIQQILMNRPNMD